MQHFVVLKDLRWQDALDIIFLAVVAYHLYVWFWGTKAFKAVVGLLALGLVYLLAHSWGLFLTTWAFQSLWQVLVFLLIILFQSELRQVLERVNPVRAISFRGRSVGGEWFSNLTSATFSMARQRIGALIVVEQKDRVEESVSSGVYLNADVSPELLITVFQKSSPLHDGALLIRNAKVACAASYLPLSAADGLPKEWGTRHRAAMGLSERCDAWVVVVSEERGNVSLARGGQVQNVASPEEMSGLFLRAVVPTRSKEPIGWWSLRSLLLKRWPQKIGALVLVGIIWFVLAGQQDIEVSLEVPLQVRNLPDQMEVLEPLNPKVEVWLQGLRKDVSTLGPGDVSAEIDLSLARFGRRTYRITKSQFMLPNDRIQVVKIEPSEVKFRFKE
jgi:diadenylate cyclase